MLKRSVKWLAKAALPSTVAFSVAAFAADALNEVAIVSPAWLQHVDGTRGPLTAGMVTLFWVHLE